MRESGQWGQFRSTYSFVNKVLLRRRDIHLVYITKCPSADLLSANEGKNHFLFHLTMTLPHALWEGVRVKHPLNLLGETAADGATRNCHRIIFTQRESTVESTMFAEFDDEILAIIVNEHGKQPLAFVVYRVRQLNAITWTTSQFFDGAFDRRESEYFVKLVGGQEKALGD
jgi:hypothetical protein